jgi:methylmalonyl-CoA mutase N-terminal domain/subunit
MQLEIQESAYRYQRAVEQGDEIVVGVNHFAVDTDHLPELLRVDPAVGRQQATRLAALRARRDNAHVQAALADLHTAARGLDNLLPPILAAVKAYATTGEICGALRQVFGEYRPRGM